MVGVTETKIGAKKIGDSIMVRLTRKASGTNAESRNEAARVESKKEVTINVWPSQE